MARVRISNSSLNSYGTRVLTEGLDISQYEKNPVLLYMHQRGKVIGYVTDIKREGDDLTGELVFDEVTDLSKQCKAQFEKGSLRMVSMGADILELSEAPEHIVQGQTRPTVSRSKLREVSVVDIGSNDDALRLTYEGKTLELGAGLECGLPALKETTDAAKPLTKEKKNMELKDIALKLGLAETASEADVTAKITELTGQQNQEVNLAAQIKILKEENDGLKLAAIEQLVDGAIADKKVSADKKNHFVELGKKVGSEELKALFAEMQPAVKLSTVIGNEGGGQDMGQHADAKKLSDLTPEQRVELKASDIKEYRSLYQAEYGVECPV
ncbi:HK97 family phage prohead protease [Xylanibacter ruminicola]|nr:HK97 family phage prohead protease [Xylanibacter ruminicola]